MHPKCFSLDPPRILDKVDASRHKVGARMTTTQQSLKKAW